jgi:drug/metabolite transporter (DMT)-like permease
VGLAVGAKSRFSFNIFGMIEAIVTDWSQNGCRGEIVLGFSLVLLSAFLFCFQNVIVRILFSEQIVFGLLPTGGFVTPTLQHSFLLMFMRMLIGVPLMAILAPRLYPPIWQDIAQLRQPEQRPVLAGAAVCGSLMFLYLMLLYVSIGMIPTGIALTLFFTYPAFTTLLAWRWFNSRPTLFRWGIMAMILLGSFLTMPQTGLVDGGNYWLGALFGITSGIAYAFYTVIAQKSFEQLHPMPFTWISFATTLLLSAMSLVVWQLQDSQIPWTPLWIGGFLSALVTFSGHLINNFGIRLVGASTASMVGATNPALTVVLAWLTIQETLNGLQILGVATVTLSVALLSLERQPTQNVDISED